MPTVKPDQPAEKYGAERHVHPLYDFGECRDMVLLPHGSGRVYVYEVDEPRGVLARLRGWLAHRLEPRGLAREAALRAQVEQLHASLDDYRDAAVVLARMPHDDGVRTPLHDALRKLGLDPEELERELDQELAAGRE